MEREAREKERNLQMTKDKRKEGCKGDENMELCSQCSQAKSVWTAVGKGLTGSEESGVFIPDLSSCLT